jgi:hypothetical protein
MVSIVFQPTKIGGHRLPEIQVRSGKLVEVRPPLGWCVQDTEELFAQLGAKVRAEGFTIKAGSKLISSGEGQSTESWPRRSIAQLPTRALSASAVELMELSVLAHCRGRSGSCSISSSRCLPTLSQSMTWALILREPSGSRNISNVEFATRESPSSLSDTRLAAPAE